MEIYRAGLQTDVLGKVIVSGSALVGIVTAQHRREIEVDPFLTDGDGMGSDIDNLETEPLLILSIEEAEELFAPVLEMNRKAGLLTRERSKQPVAV